MVAIVTGGGRGIGRSVALCLARVGFDVAVISREPPEHGAEVVSEIAALGRQASYFAADIADIESHKRILDEIENRHGIISCQVNNAGVTSLRRDDMLDLTIESFDRCMDVNLRGTFFLTQDVARRMLRSEQSQEAPYRSIITITSVNAEIVGENRADYCMTKAALSMMCKLFATRLARDGIHVFEIRPGIIRTEMTAPATAKYERYIQGGGVPLARWGSPDDVGRAAATIARGALPFATGEVINVGGGMHLHRV